MASILIIDDDPSTISTAERHLARLGYTVFTSSDAIKGAMAAKIHRPDVILADFLMPGQPSQSLFKALLERPETKDIPVVIMTGYPSESIQSYVPAPLKGNIVKKPLDYDELNGLIQKLLKHRPPQS